MVRMNIVIELDVSYFTFHFVCDVYLEEKLKVSENVKG